MTPSDQDFTGTQAGAQSNEPQGLPPLLLRADATPEMGVGHAMRLLALAQEALSRGRPVLISGDLSIPWVHRAYRDAGIEMHAPTEPAELLELADRLAPAAVLLDGYHLGREYGELLRAAGHRVGAMVDGPFGAEQSADLYIDQNPGTTPRPTHPPQQAIAGAHFTLFRDDVLAARDRRVTTETQAANSDASTQPLRILAVFGGTDPMGAAPVVAPLIARAATQAGVPINLTVVTRNAALAETVRPHLPPTSTCSVSGSVPDLADRAAVSDLVVTASGSTVWELLCIAVPTAVVCVADNQKPGYDFATEGGYAAGIGELASLRTDRTAQETAILTLRENLTNAPVRRRRSAAGAALLDGRGRVRVFDALMPPVSSTE